MFQFGGLELCLGAKSTKPPLWWRDRADWTKVE